MKNKLFFFFTYEGFRRTQAGAQNQTDRGEPGPVQRHVALRAHVGRPGRVRQHPPGGGGDGRSQDAVGCLRQDPGVEQRQQLRPRGLARGPRPEHRRLPVGPDAQDRAQLLRRPRRLRGHAEPPVRGDLHLLERHRRPPGPRLHHRAQRTAAGVHVLADQAVRRRLAVAGDLAVPERNALRRQPGAGAVRGVRVRAADAPVRRPERQPALDARRTRRSRSSRRAATPTRTSSATTPTCSWAITPSRWAAAGRT